MASVDLCKVSHNTLTTRIISHSGNAVEAHELLSTLFHAIVKYDQCNLKKALSQTYCLFKASVLPLLESLTIWINTGILPSSSFFIVSETKTGIDKSRLPKFMESCYATLEDMTRMLELLNRKERVLSLVDLLPESVEGGIQFLR